MDKKELKEIINQFPKDTFTRADKSEFELYREHLNEYTALAMVKYLKGRIEHRSTPDEIDCETEIQNELMDINAYQFIKTLQRDCKPKKFYIDKETQSIHPIEPHWIDCGCERCYPIEPKTT